MSIETAIAWCDSTLNLMMGCDGCELWNGARRSCYAGTMVERYEGRNGWPFPFDVPKRYPYRLPQALKWPDLTGKPRPKKPWLDGKPRLIFLNDMGDTFTESLPKDWLAPYIPQIAATPHQWLVLTKRPGRADWMPDIGNLWLGTSVTDQRTADARIPKLTLVEPEIRFVSAEPLLGPVDLTDWLWYIDWVIVGGESGKDYREMKPEWARKIRDDCEAADVPFFFKQSSGLRSEMNPLLDGREWRGMP